MINGQGNKWPPPRAGDRLPEEAALGPHHFARPSGGHRKQRARSAKTSLPSGRKWLRHSQAGLVCRPDRGGPTSGLGRGPSWERAGRARDEIGAGENNKLDSDLEEVESS